MITTDEINNLLLSGEVEYIRRAFLKARLDRSKSIKRKEPIKALFILTITV